MGSAGEERRSDLREAYGTLAQTGGDAAGALDCCSPSEGPQGPVPGDAGTVGAGLGPALGCGDPVTLARLSPGETVLDLGSGGGLDCFRAAEGVGSSGRVIGVDMTPEMISRAQSNLESVGSDNVEFRLGDIERLPVADESVDVVISNCVLNLAPDRDRAFREAYRVLRPGGRLAICDVLLDKPLPENLLRRLPDGGACLAGAIPEVEYVRAMRDAGFLDVAVEREYAGPAVPAALPAGARPQLRAQIGETGESLVSLDLDSDTDLATLPRSFNGSITARRPLTDDGVPARAEG